MGRMSNPWDAKARSVYVQGDSLSVDLGPGLKHRLPGWSIRIDAKSGRHMVEGTMRLSKTKLPGVVVYALGSNDYSMPAWWHRLQLDRVARFTGSSRCLVLVSVWADGKPRPTFNSQIHWLRSRYPTRRIQTAGWAEAVANRGVRLIDGTHPQNWIVRSRLLADAIKRC